MTSDKKSRKFLVGGNWKMNGYRALIDTVTTMTLADLPSDYSVDVVVCPPFPYLPLLITAVRKMSDPRIQVGAQNIHSERTGAFTGEVSFPMLTDLGVDWAIVGHSERRQLYGETNESAAAKFHMILKDSYSMRVIFCVGETLEEREAGRTEAVLESQLRALLPEGTVLSEEDRLKWAVRLVVAYEPVWAIGTGKVATAEQASAAHAFIRKFFAENAGDTLAQDVRVIYGGSVNAGNCRELASQPDIDGFLVGGASIKGEFRDIVLSRRG